MNDEEIKVVTWLEENGVADAATAKVLFLALNQPGEYGAYRVAYGQGTVVVTGPAGAVTLDGSTDIQQMRMRLDEIIARP